MSGISPGEIYLPLLAAGLTGVALALLLRHRASLPQAISGPRSLHRGSVLRIAGLAIWVGWLPSAILAAPVVPGSRYVWLLAWLGIALLSLIDDWRGVHPFCRLAVQLTAAASLAVGFEPWGLAMGWGSASWLAVPLAALVIAWSANLYNFMDGNDGLAATMGICGFGAYGAAAVLAGQPSAAYFSLVLSTLVFFTVNVPPARAFLGDIGAVPMGFLAGAFGLAGWQMQVWPAWFPLLVFLPFIADASLTLARRISRRERVWEAHKGHYYQRLHRMGAGHAGTLAVFGTLIVGTSVTAILILMLWPANGWIATAAWLALIGAFFLGIDYHWRRRAPESS